MSGELSIAIAGLAALVMLIAARMPVAYAMIIVGGIGATILSGAAVMLAQLKDLAFSQFSVYDLSVVPMFVLMGSIAAKSGLSYDLFRAANAWLGRFRGGVAMAAVAACAGFGAVSGSSLATASTMGKVALPELRRYNYAPALATGTVAAGGTLGILIPPSVVLVIYAIITEASIAAMFKAALIPGLIAVLFFIAVIAVYVRAFPDAGPRGAKVGANELRRATIGVLPVVGVFGLVIGGIYLGAFNPTPAAAIGAFVVGVFGFVSRRFKLSDLRESLLETARTTGMIYLILLGAEMLKIFMSRAGAPQAAAEMAASSGLEPLAVLCLLLLALILLGCLMDSLSMILLVVPFFWPVISAMNFGMDEESLKIWFGIAALIVVELGLITPPVGMNVYVINSLTPQIPMRQTFAGVLPFFCAELFRIAIIIAFPGLVLFLPQWLS